MSVQKREKRFMTAQEKRLRHLMVEHQVSMIEIAEYEEVSDQSVITNRFKNLTPSSLEHYEDLILKLSKAPQKVAS